MVLAVTSASAQSQYPLVLTSASKLKELGIAVGYSVSLPNRCYHYGEGGDSVSISDALLNFYKLQGFSLRSACMALVSGIKFNPETGKRLATFILADPKLFKNGRPDPKYWSHGSPTELGEITDELPLSLPTCFGRGLPYTDCEWRYDPMTGKEISAADTAKQKRVGNSIEKILSDPHSRKRFNSNPSRIGEDGFIEISGFSGNWSVTDDPFGASYDQPWHDVHFDYAGGELQIHVFYDYSSEFPKGYGYALLYVNDGGAGPGVSPKTVKAAIDGQRKPSQIDITKLKDTWNSGSN